MWASRFNLCHFLKLDDEKNLEQRLQEAMPYLFAVSINGADGGETNRCELGPLDPNPRSRQLRRGPRARNAQAFGLHGPGRAPVLRHPRRSPRKPGAIHQSVAEAKVCSMITGLEEDQKPSVLPRSVWE